MTGVFITTFMYGLFFLPECVKEVYTILKTGFIKRSFCVIYSRSFLV